MNCEKETKDRLMRVAGSLSWARSKVNFMALVCVVIIAGGLANGPTALATVITTADGVGADATLISAYPDRNYAESGTNYLEVRNNRYSILRWGPLSLPGPVTDAELSLQVAFVQDPQADYQVYGLADGVGEDWDEDAITWNSAPGLDNTLDADAGPVFTGDVTLLGSMPSGTNEGDVFTFSSQGLVDFLNTDTDGQVTLFLRSEANPTRQALGADNDSTYNGTAAHPPTLNITAVPEPGSLALLMLGLLGWMRIRILASK